MLILTSFQLEQSHSVKYFIEKSLVPILRIIDMMITRYLTFKYPVILRENPHPSQLKFYIFDIYRVITVVVEEKDIAIMLVAKCFVVGFLHGIHQICNSYILLRQTGK